MTRIAKPKGKVIRADWAWKEENTTYRKPVRVSAKTKRKIARRKALKEKRLARRERNMAYRDAALRHFGLHKFTSWIAIADLVHGEIGGEMPGTEKKCKAMAIAFGRDLVNPKREYRPRMSNEKFYASTKWRELRYIALKNSGGSCTLCGARASDGVTLHVDHIVPRSVDPRKEFDLDNLQIMCDDCNIGKSNRDSIDWRQI
jgi:5-methylcytosine-specific restriction endonuclease McrA